MAMKYIIHHIIFTKMIIVENWDRCFDLKNHFGKNGGKYGMVFANIVS
jgi:hypothetical protein